MESTGSARINYTFPATPSPSDSSTVTNSYSSAYSPISDAGEEEPQVGQYFENGNALWRNESVSQYQYYGFPEIGMVQPQQQIIAHSQQQINIQPQQYENVPPQQQIIVQPQQQIIVQPQQEIIVQPQQQLDVQLQNQTDMQLQQYIKVQTQQQINLQPQQYMNMLSQQQLNVQYDNSWNQIRLIPSQNSENFLPVSSTTSGRKRQQRTQFSKQHLDRLEEEFQQTRYPSRITRIKLAQILNLTEEKVKVWFQNRRCKYRKENKTANTAKQSSNKDVINSKASIVAGLVSDLLLDGKSSSMSFQAQTPEAVSYTATTIKQESSEDTLNLEASIVAEIANDILYEEFPSFSSQTQTPEAARDSFPTSSVEFPAINYQVGCNSVQLGLETHPVENSEARINEILKWLTEEL